MDKAKLTMDVVIIFIISFLSFCLFTYLFIKNIILEKKGHKRTWQVMLFGYFSFILLASIAGCIFWIYNIIEFDAHMTFMRTWGFTTLIGILMPLIIGVFISLDAGL